MKMTRNLGTLVATALLLPGVAFAQATPPSGGDTPTPAAPSAAPPAPVLTQPSATPDVINAPADPLSAGELANYRLDTGDTVLVNIERHGDVSRTISLLNDASVLLPRMEKPIPARGMTCTTLANAIYKSLNNPRALRLTPGQVTVSLVGQRIRRIFVRGNAVRGADVDLKNDWRITELVAVMGGVPQPDRVRVSLTNPKRPAPVAIDLNAALANAQSPANILLMEGDTLVFDGPRAKYFFISGEGPRGRQEVDERYTLKQALIALGMTYNNQSGELRKATLKRHTIPDDPTSPTTEESVDLVEVLSNDAVDHDLKNYDTLNIPLSMRYYYVWGELGGARKRWLAEDRKTYLLDVMSDSGNTTPGQAKIGDVTIIRNNGTPQPTILHYDYGKFLRNGDAKYNPEIQPQDLVFVPNVKRVDPVNTIWTGFGLFNIIKTFVPGLP